MARAIILTGGNVGDVKTRLQNAQRLINQHAGPVMRCSHRYKSRAWGFDAEEEFSNQVLEVDTDLMPEQLLDALQAIERELGARPRGRTVAQTKDRSPIYVAPDRHRHTLLRRPRDSHRAADRSPSVDPGARIRARPPVRMDARLPPSGVGENGRRAARRAEKSE